MFPDQCYFVVTENWKQKTNKYLFITSTVNNLFDAVGVINFIFFAVFVNQPMFQLQTEHLITFKMKKASSWHLFLLHFTFLSVCSPASYRMPARFYYYSRKAIWQGWLSWRKWASERNSAHIQQKHVSSKDTLHMNPARPKKSSTAFSFLCNLLAVHQHQNQHHCVH